MGKHDDHLGPRFRTASKQRALPSETPSQRKQRADNKGRDRKATAKELKQAE